MAEHPMTVDEFNEAATGFYELLSNMAGLLEEISGKLTRLEKSVKEAATDAAGDIIGNLSPVGDTQVVRQERWKDLHSR